VTSATDIDAPGRVADAIATADGARGAGTVQVGFVDLR
jgi:hypothetical protein